MITGAAIADHLLTSLHRAQRGDVPFRHWLLTDLLPEAATDALRALPYVPPVIEDTAGRRETCNASRQFFAPRDQGEHSICAAIAQAYQDPRVTRALEDLCAVSLAGGYLRVEYCLDSKGFWLEPHTDIGAKLFTHLIYLSTGPGSEAWGTDLLTPDGELVARAPAKANSGLIFIPASDSWHGFAPRPIEGVRRTLIVNYVRDEWRARHELCFPDRPIDK
jgi:hypothetical protein